MQKRARRVLIRTGHKGMCSLPRWRESSSRTSRQLRKLRQKFRTASHGRRSSRCVSHSNTTNCLAHQRIAKRQVAIRHAVVTENSVRSENTGVPIIREIMVATTMSSLFVAFFALLASTFRTRAALQAEILALRHQLAVFQKNAPRRLRLHRCDRLLWVVLYRCWSGWRRCLEMVQPDTVLRWHRRAFAWHWTRNRAAFPAGQKLRRTFVI